MKSDKIDRDIVKRLRTEMETDLRSLAQKHNLTIVVGGANFNNDNIVFQVEVAVNDELGRPKNREAEDFRRYGNRFGLKPEHLYSEVTFRNHRYRLIGLLPKSYKFPILAERLDTGQKFKLSATEVLPLLKEVS